MHAPSGEGKPTPNSHFEHSSVPATLKKMFNLGDDFLTKRDAWAGTFESAWNNSLTEPRTGHVIDAAHLLTSALDCPMTLPSPPELRQNALTGARPISELQETLMRAAAATNAQQTMPQVLVMYFECSPDTFRRSGFLKLRALVSHDSTCLSISTCLSWYHLVEDSSK